MRKSSGAGMVLMGVGTHLSAMVITGFALGYGLDLWWDTKPVFMLILGVMGFIGGLIKAHRLLSNWSSKKN